VQPQFGNLPLSASLEYASTVSGRRSFGCVGRSFANSLLRASPAQAPSSVIARERRRPHHYQTHRSFLYQCSVVGPSSLNHKLSRTDS